MTIKLIKDESSIGVSTWYITCDEIYVSGSISLTEDEGIIKYNEFVSRNQKSKQTIILETKINEPNENCNATTN